MPRRKKQLPFADKLVLNQWILDLLGIDPLAEHSHNGKRVRPFVMLTTILRDCPEGLDDDSLHRFYHTLKAHWQPTAKLSLDALLQYEENIVAHTAWLNAGREQAIEWKYYQWLSLLFAEIYLHQYFSDRHSLLESLNQYITRFKSHWANEGFETGISYYTLADLNKLCLQNATGSGKTLLMHVNYRQFIHYAGQAGELDTYARALLITPNENLSAQHARELRASGIDAARLVMESNDLFASDNGHLGRIDTIEITKLGERDGDKTIATRNLGDQNLLLVDEGHRGMGSSEEQGWFRQRERLTEQGFAFEYSATFREAVKAAKRAEIEDAYAKAVLFDYSYRFFYADGYGKDYRIFNLPTDHEQHEYNYLTACLLSFYQQLRLYGERHAAYAPFNLEKPLWVFVGSSVSQSGGTKDEKATASDIVRILSFLADFLADEARATHTIDQLLRQSADKTGLVDDKGRSIFNGAFLYLADALNKSDDATAIYRDILARLFNNPAGGQLKLLRLKGDSGEILLKAGTAERHFGLINVGDAKGLADHVHAQCPAIDVGESEFQAGLFDTVRESSSDINVLLGAKKFIEGWDCWRVSTLGLMNVGKSEGSQIIQLFGRGVRLKGHAWSLKRSGAVKQVQQPDAFIRYLETLDVFGVNASFMEKFRDFLQEEKLPANDDQRTFTIPMNLTHDFGHKLMVIRPKRKDGAGRDYNFNRDGAMPRLGDVPDYLTKNRVLVDWYPKIQAITSTRHGGGDADTKHEASLQPAHLAFVDMEQLYFELEAYKARENLYSLIIRIEDIQPLLARSDWYRLLVPTRHMATDQYANVRVWQQIALELLKRYCKKYYLHMADAFFRPRLEARELTAADDNLPGPDDHYSLTVDASEEQLAADLERLEQAVTQAIQGNKSNTLIAEGSMQAMLLDNHLYQPLLHAPKDAPVRVAPVALNESEMAFVTDLQRWLQTNDDILKNSDTSVYLLRNKSRGKGMGFFEAGNFYPDFILWLVLDNKQVVIFIEPHGISHEGPEHPKIQFHRTIKDVERRLADTSLQLESFVVTPTRLAAVADRGLSRDQWAERHLLFMHETGGNYIDKILAPIVAACGATA